MKILRFGEGGGSGQWYETTEGIVKCNEDIIDTLWWVWVSSKNSRRADRRSVIVFEFIEPIHIDLEKEVPYRLQKNKELYDDTSK